MADHNENNDRRPPKKLFGLLSRDSVRAKLNANDWIEAAHLVGDVLVNAGDIEPRYVEALINIIKDVGPYPVIAPGLVLLHSRPEDGVINPCIALVTLRTPVNFGHSENDPVDIVFALGAVDKNSHIGGLKLIADFLSEEGSIESLRKPETDEDLFKVFLSWEKKIH